jgi:NAD(P)-dependent dehydrogenase (short-subunit alcohol dehydrogenase family)
VRAICWLAATEHAEAAKEGLTNDVARAGIEAVAADLADPSGAAQLIEDVGAVDILVSNAGQTEVKPFFDLTDEDWDRYVNIYSPVARRCWGGAGRRGDRPGTAARRRDRPGLVVYDIITVT